MVPSCQDIDLPDQHNLLIGCIKLKESFPKMHFTLEGFFSISFIEIFYLIVLNNIFSNSRKNQVLSKEKNSCCKIAFVKKLFPSCVSLNIFT